MNCSPLVAGILAAWASLSLGCARPSNAPPAAAPVAPAALPVRPSSPPAPKEPLALVTAGSLEVKGQGTAGTRLALASLAMTARTTGDVAETTVEHVFHNDADQTLEGTFRFPLPEGAILTGLAMEIDGKLVEGELVERDKARKVYEKIVDEMQDPALLEWENGQTFKLRVFPIEPKRDKRVVLRFVAPLHRREAGPDAGLYFGFRAPADEAALPARELRLTVDGRPIPVTPGRDVLVRAGELPEAGVVRETTKEASYWLARVRPDLGASVRAEPGRSSGQALILLGDRSRSMLEARGLQKDTVGMLLADLEPADRFTVVVGDVRTRSFGPLRPVDVGARAAALDFVDGAEPDGASDLGKLLGAAGPAVEAARAQGLEPVVVYLGDGTATWGETRAAELERIAREASHGAALHVVMLGKSPDEAGARALAAGGRGRLLRPKTAPEAERTAADIVATRTRRRLDDVHVVGADGLEMPGVVPSTLYEGDELPLLLRASVSGAPAPREIALAGTEGERPFLQRIALDHATLAGHVAQRWAKAKIEAFEGEGDAHKQEIIQTSLAHGVMSRYTSFLVLDSEEAYARFQIARRAKAASDGTVTGADLDGSARGATVTPDHLQPGDPEVRIPAPADATSVVVVFPFGETKTATYEPGEDGVSASASRGGAWVVRFLVDRRTPDGSYEILARITHRDGHVEIVRIPYVVDTQRPNLDVTLTKKHDGSYVVEAKQRLSDAEVEAQAPLFGGTPGALESRRQRYAHVLTDAKRVEVRTPDGQTLSLVHVRLGEFRGIWTPAASPMPGSKLRVVAVDRALNESVTEVEVTR